MSSKIDDKHKHIFKPKKLKVTMYRYGESKTPRITGTDILKQHICECGKTITYDLERQRG